MDARRFFSTGIDTRGNLPVSLLRTAYNEVAIGIMGQDAAGDRPSPRESRSSGATSGNQESRTF
jgi:hypothetical protein